MIWNRTHYHFLHHKSKHNLFISTDSTIWMTGRTFPIRMARNRSLEKKKKTHFKAQYMRNPDVVYILKMEYVSKLNIFGLKMMVKSCLEKIFLKFLYAQGLFQVCPVGCLSLVLLNWDSQQGRSEKGLAHGGISKIFFVMYVHIINKTLSHKFHPYSILSTKYEWVAYESWFPS